MTTKLLLWLILAVLLGWLWFGSWFCCWQQWLCPDCVEGIASEEQIGAVSGQDEAVLAHKPIEFLWGSAKAHTYPGWDSLKNVLMAQMEDGKILEVQGYYWEGEKAPEGFETMGFARAEEVINLLANDIPRDRMVPKSLSQQGSYVEGDVLDAIAFNWIEAAAPTEGAEEETPVEPAVEQISTERVLFRFASNSAKTGEIDPEIETYLDKVAERVKTTGEKILLVGHTDSDGDEKMNMRLGRKRAESVRKLLLDRGVSKAQIKVKSMGSKDPVASNETEAGKAENRRVELRIQKE